MQEQFKTQVIETAQKAQREGLCKHKSGNISVYDPESGFFFITPSGVDREKLTPDDICVLDLELNQKSGGKPSSESLMHAACYRARSDIRAIVHTHSRMATAFSVLNKPIPATVFEMFVFPTENACIPVAPYALPGTEALADNVARVIAKNDMALMERHGAIAVGKARRKRFWRHTIRRNSRSCIITRCKSTAVWNRPYSPKKNWTGGCIRKNCADVPSGFAVVYACAK